VVDHPSFGKPHRTTQSWNTLSLFSFLLFTLMKMPILVGVSYKDRCVTES